ncbi:T9SS type A sorting domain-containing protein [Pontibacter ruber]|uniref:T9SS type A sorting domain-containing protein n=1 Tax=Pontibacter ruber TaxID=1343895 RepID=A0ABW5CV15_9BACT|nr:T9SS type A sorting domain-containing protein [Pontibacter ruber]
MCHPNKRQQSIPSLLRWLVGCCCLLITLPGMAQSKVGIGGWQLHIPYTQGKSVAEAGDRVYAAAEQGLFYYDKEFNNTQAITKVDGLSEQRISTIRYEEASGTLVIAYANSNIDLLQGDKITNISDILRRQLTGDKRIHHILTRNKIAYLATGFGVVVLDLAKQEIKDTYTNLGPNGAAVQVRSTAILGDSMYLATNIGILAAHRISSNLKDFRSWHQRNAGFPESATLTSLADFNGQLYAGTTEHGLFILGNGTWQSSLIPAGTAVSSLTPSADFLSITTPAAVILINKQGQATTITNNLLKQPREATVGAGNILWVADAQRGLVRINLNNNETAAFAPEGPASSNSFRVYAANGMVYVLSGGYNENYEPLNRTDGYSTFQNGDWTSNNGFQVQGGTVPVVLKDMTDAVYNPLTGHVYMASYGNGVLAWLGQEQPILYNSTNSTLVSSQPATDKTEQVRVTDLAVDSKGNVWAVNRSQIHNAPGLHVLQPDGQWQGFILPGVADNSNLDRLVIDENDYKWLSISWNGNVRNGLVVLNEEKQEVRQLSSEAGNGGLPSGTVYSMAKDLNGDIWVGTAAGVAVYYNTAAVFTSQQYDARLPIIDKRPLLDGQVVRDIAVDGANRKWMATDNGLWLFGPDGDELIHHFTTQNSPLPSDKVLSVTVEHQTGEVFVATEAGLASYRAGATITEGKPDCATVFPNPVRPSYTGLIGVSGLPNNAQVRITDISGTLVYKTIAAGGTVTWDARGYNGKRVKGGVYLVMASDDEGKQTCISKIAVLE